MRNSNSFYISTVLLCLTILIIFLISHRAVPKVVSTNLEKIPYEIGEYDGIEDRFDASIYDELNADAHLYRHYRSKDNTQIDLYIGYYGTAKGGRTGHNPHACLPGSGWGIIEDHFITVMMGKKQKKLNMVVSQKNSVYNIMIHWYQSDKNKVLASGIHQNVHRFISRIIKNKNDGAFVRVSMMANLNGLKQAQQKVIHFSERVLLILPKYWPEER